MKWFFRGLKKYGIFQGRASRKEFWMFMLVYIIIYIMFMLSMMITGVEQQQNDKTYMMETTKLSTFHSLLTTLYPIFVFGTLLPALAIIVRRLHDTGRSGWWFFISFIAFVGGTVLLVFLLLDGDEQENQYGPNPKTIR